MSQKVLSNLDFGGTARCVNHPDPVGAQDVATKAYVDSRPPVDLTSNLAWTGSHSWASVTFTVSTSGDIVMQTSSAADILLRAAGGIGLFANLTAAGVDTGDIVINAASGIAIVSDTTTPIVSAVQGIRLQSAADVRLASSSGIGLFANLTEGDVSDSDLVLNAAGGMALTTNATTAVTSVTNGQMLFSAYANIEMDATGFFICRAGNDVIVSTTAGGLVLSTTTAGHPTGVTNGQLNAESQGSVNILAGSQFNVTTGVITPASSATFTCGAGFNVTAATDILLTAASGIGLFAGLTSVNTSGGDIILNASNGLGLFAGYAAAEPDVSSSDLSIGGASGVAITAGIAVPITNVSSGMLLESLTTIRLDTAATQRWTLNANGSWNIGGSTGAFGDVPTSAGSGAPPTWQKATPGKAALSTTTDPTVSAGSTKLSCGGSVTIPANTLIAGALYRFTAHIRYVKPSAGALPGQNYEIFLNGSAISPGGFSFMSIGPVAGNTGGVTRLEVLVSVRSLGASGDARATYIHESSWGSTNADRFGGGEQAFTIDTTASNTLELQTWCSAGTPGSSLTVKNAVVERVF